VLGFLPLDVAFTLRVHQCYVGFGPGYVSLTRTARGPRIGMRSSDEVLLGVLQTNLGPAVATVAFFPHHYLNGGVGPPCRGGVDMGQRFLAGVKRRPRYEGTVALVLAIGRLLALIPVTVGAARSTPTSAAAR
jgi:hypothetical protein